MNRIIPRLLAVLLFFLSPTFFFAQENNPGAGRSKNYYLHYNIKEYNRGIEDSLNYFIDNMLKSGDQIVLITPMKMYLYSQKKLSLLSNAKLKEDLTGRLKKDTSTSGAEFQNIFGAMQDIVLDMSQGRGSGDSSGLRQQSSSSEIKALVTRYGELRGNLAAISGFNNPVYLKIAELSKDQTRSHFLIVFLEQLFVPIPDQETLDRNSSGDAKFQILESFRLSLHDDFDISAVKAALIESKVRLDFIYCNKKITSRRGMDLKESSTDLYNAYHQLAGATGGMIEATYDPASSLNKIAESLNGVQKAN